MGILGFFRGRDGKQPDIARISDKLVLEATDHIVKLANPRLALAKRYRERLAPSVEKTIRHLRSLAGSLPAVRTATAAAWSLDSSLHAYFAKAEELPRAFGRARDLRAWFDENPAQDEALAVLGMALSEQKVLGMALHGDTVQREVAQVAVSFSDHQVRICAPDEKALRLKIGWRLYEHLGLIALARIGGGKSAREKLEGERALLGARLRMLRKQGAGMASAVGSGPEADAEGLQALERKLAENDRKLAEAGAGPAVLDRELEIVREVLEDPASAFGITPRKLVLDAMNTKVEGTASGPVHEVEFAEVVLGGDAPVKRACALVRIPRGELLSEKKLLAEAHRYI